MQTQTRSQCIPQDTFFPDLRERNYRRKEAAASLALTAEAVCVDAFRIGFAAPELVEGRLPLALSDEARALLHHQDVPVILGMDGWTGGHRRVSQSG